MDWLQDLPSVDRRALLTESATAQYEGRGPPLSHIPLIMCPFLSDGLRIQLEEMGSPLQPAQLHTFQSEPAMYYIPDFFFTVEKKRR